MDLFFQASSKTKLNKDEVKEWMRKAAKKAEVSKSTGERRIKGGSGFLINEAKSITEDIFQALAVEQKSSYLLIMERLNLNYGAEEPGADLV